MNNFEQLKKEIIESGRLLMEYVRGSHAYGLNNADSDLDTGGIYIATPDEILGMTGYMPQVSDDKHDNTYYEIGNFIQLLTKSNPTVMEALFMPDDKIIGELSPIMKELRANRDKLLSKDIYWPFYGYAKAQIEKARGLNKKIVNPVEKRLTPLDFTYTFEKQGSKKIMDWLEERGLKMQFCGLNRIPHMNDMYGVYYDWGAHYQSLIDTSSAPLPKDFITQLKKYYNKSFSILDKIKIRLNLFDFNNFCDSLSVYHYRGITTEFVDHTTQLRLSSIDDKNDRPICHISYNMGGFQDHCKKYKEYQDWVKERNPKRYESNLDKNYDSKNMMHCFRLIHMCKEILQDHQFNLIRTWDHDFLMDIRNHKYEYDELIDKLDEEVKEMKEIYDNSTLPEHIDKKLLNDILINIRKEQLRDNI